MAAGQDVDRAEVRAQRAPRGDGFRPDRGVLFRGLDQHARPRPRVQRGAVLPGGLAAGSGEVQQPCHFPAGR